MRGWTRCCALAVLLVSATAAWAEDSDVPRWYLQLRLRDTDNSTGVHDLYGAALGANVNRYLGFELAGDRFELFPKISGLGTIGEYGVFALVPQVRVRYPLFGDRLVPYAVGGAGIALTDFNDRKQPGFGRSIKDESSTFVGTLGAGLEYFVADNIAFGVEFKYLFGEKQTLKVDGVRHDFDISSPLTMATVRLFYPELRPAPLADAAATERSPTRFYLGFRVGGAVPTDRELASGLKADPVPAAVGGVFNHLFGITPGLDITRHLGVELAAEGYETRLTRSGLGAIGEYAVYIFTPTLRVRYPVADGRLVPYGLAGVGVSYTEFNDRKPPGAGLDVESKTFAVAGSIGAGVDYFLMRNIAVNLESKFFYSPGHSIRIDGHDSDVTLQTMLVSLGIRVYLADLFGR